jgi:hypothetical protein
MVQTRSGEVSTASHSKAAPKPAAEKDSKKQDSKNPIETKTVNDTAQTKPNKPTEERDDPAKRKRDENETQAPVGVDGQSPSSQTEQPPPKKAAREEAEKDSIPKHEYSEDTTIHKINKTIDEYGSLPLAGMAVKEPLKPTPETLLALVIHSMLKSARISHHLAEKAAVGVIDAGYHDIKTLSEASWDD